MMTNIFNTQLEIESRLILLMSEFEKSSLTAEGATALDFMAIYPEEFDIVCENLNGNSVFKFSEVTDRLIAVSEALKTLYIYGLLSVSMAHGISYQINDAGRAYIEGFQCSYSKEYLSNLNVVKQNYLEYIQKDSGSLFDFILRKAEQKLARGDQ